MTVQEKMWVEKYRPEALDEVVGHEATIGRLKKYASDEGVPHMIFAGPAGTGKTAAATAFAHDALGNAWKANFDEMNASDERGIEVIRNKVKATASQSATEGAAFRILFLDEADHLTDDAQAALRRIMEKHSDNTRFFLSCNYPNKLIDAIQSRCTVFRFGGLADEEVKEVLKRVIEEEDLDVDTFAIEKIVRDARGDARSAITALQSSAVDGEVTEDTVETVTGVVDDREVGTIVDKAVGGDLEEAMDRLDENLLKKGVDPQTLSDSFLRVLKRKKMPQPGRQKCINKLAETEWRIMHGANPHVQFHSLLCDIHVGYHLDYNKEQYEP